MMRTFFFLFFLAGWFISYGQTFYFGSDLSYVNQMEDCGAVYKEANIEKDVYRIFADHGTNLVRVRLWYEPTWQNPLIQPDGVKPQYSDFVDVKETISRAKAAGMMVMLDFHLSDFWADPGHQIIPSKWVGVATDTAALADSVYNYVVKVLTDLEQDTLMPELVKVGNENNGGILRHTTLNSDYSAGGSVSTSWARHAHLYKSAIRAVRDVSLTTDIKPLICLHYAGLDYITSWYQTLINNGVTDFDIIGFSYYYAWHGGSISAMGNTIRALKTTFPAYDVMVAETGYPWTNENFDGMGNIVTTPDPAYLPMSPEKQLEYMVDLTREIINAGGCGLIFWEPAWVSTPCTTPWGQGSSHDHLAFFDPVNTNFMENGAGRWPESSLYENPDYRKLTLKVASDGADINGKMFVTGTFTGDPWTIMPMYNEAPGLYGFATYLLKGDSGAFYFLNDSSWDAREFVPAECAPWWGTDRGYKIGENDTIIGYNWESCTPVGAQGDVIVTFKVDMTGQDISKGVWITGTMTGDPWSIIPMAPDGGRIYKYVTTLSPGDSGAFYFMNDDDWGSREVVPIECATWWNSDRGYKIGTSDTTFGFTWGTCLPLGSASSISNASSPGTDILIYPNPVTENSFSISLPAETENLRVYIMDLTGRVHYNEIYNAAKVIQLHTNLNSGTYILCMQNESIVVNSKLTIRSTR